jgi:nucleotide-binding universal stress UspA family protein
VFKRIAVANDGSEGGRKAFALACDLARAHRAALYMISVEVLPDFPATIDEIAEAKEAENHKFHDVLESAQKIAKKKGVKLEAEVVAGHAAASIVERVKRLKADLLVVGFMGHSALYERIIGGTADRLVRLAPCPVLVVK